MSLYRKLLVAQELVFQATVRDNSNWIRFLKDSKFHVAISRGDVLGVSLEDVVIVGDMCEVVAHPTGIR